LDYFSQTNFNIKIRFKIDNNKDPWTLEQADTALKNYIENDEKRGIDGIK
jgi:predicted AlkP superfamily pyrophosphatase or phosphodiesterase